MLKHMAKKEVIFTVLVAGEGDTETAFLRYCKSLFCPRGCGRKVTLKQLHGGSPKQMINDVIAHIKISTYNRSVCVLDADITVPEAIRKNAKQKGIELIQPDPNIEGLLLQTKGHDVSTWSSRECKVYFENNYLDETKKLNPENYAKLFSANELQTATNTIPPMQKILKCFID